MPGRVFLILLILFSTTAIHSQQEITALKLGSAVERELAGGLQHVYQFRLNEAQYAKVIVQQRGIDVVVELMNLKGEPSIRCDYEYRTQGEEKVEMVAPASGDYKLILSATSKNASKGRYEISIAEIRDSTENDRSMNEARILEADFNRAFLAGRYEDARKSIERALAISENISEKEHPFVATLLHDLAKYYNEKKDLGKAVSLLERAIAIAEKTWGDDHPYTIDISRLIVPLYFDTNEIGKSERLVQRGYDISQKVLGPNHYLVGQYSLTLADFTNDKKKEEQLLHRALEITEQTVGTEHPFIGEVLNELGVFYMAESDYQKTEMFLLRAQEVFTKTKGPQNISHVIILTNLGRLAREKKDFTKAEEYYRKAIAIIEKAFGPENPRLAPVLNNLANIYRIRGDYTKSLEAHLRVLRISEATYGPYYPMTLMSLGNVARTYAAEGKIAEAIQYQSRAETVLERNIDMNLAVGSEHEKISYMQKWFPSRTDRTISLNANLAPNDSTASALAALVLLQRKGRVLDAMSETFASLRQRATPEEQTLLDQFNEINAQLAKLVLNGPQKMSFQEHRNKISELEDQKQRLEAEISRRSEEFRARSQPITLAAIQSNLPENAALIEYAIFRPFDPNAEHTDDAYKEPRYIAYVLLQKEILWRDLGEVKVIDASIEAFRQALRDPKNKQVNQLARKLDEMILHPLRPLVLNATQFLISPDGALNLVPFEALVDEQNRFLIERSRFTYLTSGRDLLRLQVVRDSQSGPIAFANPTFGEPHILAMAETKSHTLSDRKRDAAAKRQSIITGTDLSEVYFAPLPGTAKEADGIHSLFKEATVLSGAQATEASLKRVTAPKILHIATHGFFLTDTADSGNASSARTRSISANAKIESPLLRSGLALAGANLQKSKDDEDGILTALEAAGLNLWGTKLVTLSACDTGLGEIKNGEGVYGLRRAFVLAGTETLVMSLWQVSDSVTREMMTSYYKGLKQGLGRGEALRQVQLSMLKRKERKHPFYWASFIQSGEWANLDGKR